MHQYTFLLRGFLTERIKNHRKAGHLTREAVAEVRHISPRSYISLERGENGCSTATFMFFLLVLPEKELLLLCADFRALVEREVEHVPL